MNIFRTYQIFFSAVIVTVLSSCGKESTCFKGTGDLVTEERDIAAHVTSIVTADNIDVVITQSSEPSMTLKGGENLLPYIHTDVSGTVLSLSSDNRCGMFRDNTKPITLYLSIPNLTRIDYTGQGNITSTNRLHFPSFVFDSKTGTGSINLTMTVNEMSILQHSGPADFSISGDVNNLYVYTSGNGWFYLDQLSSKSVHINHSGIGDVFVNVVDELSVELRSRGSVYYIGNPTVEVSPRIGEGNVLPK